MNADCHSLTLPVNRIALFTDLDGTLVELCERPDQVRLVPSFRTTLRRLMNGLPALAIVSGRPICQVDQILASHDCVVAGLHGAEIRLDGHIARSCQSFPIPGEISRFLDDALGPLAQTVLEHKGHAVALHYREHPELAGRLKDLARDITQRYPDLTVMNGKCVLELKPGGIDKGQAIDCILQRQPFCGRIPVFIGDDVTDEDGFRLVNRKGGISIKVGPEASAAGYRLQNVADVHTWLRKLSAAL